MRARPVGMWRGTAAAALVVAVAALGVLGVLGAGAGSAEEMDVSAAGTTVAPGTGVGRTTLMPASRLPRHKPVPAETAPLAAPVPVQPDSIAATPAPPVPTPTPIVAAPEPPTPVPVAPPPAVAAAPPTPAVAAPAAAPEPPTPAAVAPAVVTPAVVTPAVVTPAPIQPAPPAATAAAPPPPPFLFPVAGERPFRIVMVLFRGPTRIEEGFRAFLTENRIPHELYIRDINRDPANLPRIIAEIRSLKPDLVYAWGTTVTLGLVGKWNAVDPARHITEFPVIFTLVADPVGAGIVERLDRPRGNVTGTSFLAPLDAQLKAIATYRPFQRLAVIYNPLEANSVLNVKELRAAGERLGFTVIEKPAPITTDKKPDAASVPRLVAEAKAEGAEFLYIGPDSFTAVVGKPLTQAAVEQRLPTFAATEAPLRDARAMFGLVSNYYTLGHFTAFKAEQILRRGRSPGEIPVETMTRFSYMLRIGVANEIKLYPPLIVVKYAEIVDMDSPDL